MRGLILVISGGFVGAGYSTPAARAETAHLREGGMVSRSSDSSDMRVTSQQVSPSMLLTEEH